MPNFTAFDGFGDLYVTDSGAWGADDGLVFRVDIDGTTDVWTDRVPGFPNGCCLSAEGDALLVVESSRRRVVRVPIGADGAAGQLRRRSSTSPARSPTASRSRPTARCSSGATGPTGSGASRPSGRPEIWLDDPDGVSLNQPANVAFIGADLDRLAISSLGGWSIVRDRRGGYAACRLRSPSARVNERGGDPVAPDSAL